jgi:hypothetical protein
MDSLSSTAWYDKHTLCRSPDALIVLGLCPHFVFVCVACVRRQPCTINMVRTRTREETAALIRRP